MSASGTGPALVRIWRRTAVVRVSFSASVAIERLVTRIRVRLIGETPVVLVGSRCFSEGAFLKSGCTQATAGVVCRFF